MKNREHFSKKRSSDSSEKGKEERDFGDPFNFFYNGSNLIEGWDIRVENVIGKEADFDVTLAHLKPHKVVLYEPHLELMRSLEVYNADRVRIASSKDSLLEVVVMRYEESTELYQNMTTIEQEKRGFADLIDIRQKLYVELKDYELEAEQKRIEEKLLAQDGGRKGDLVYQQLEEKRDIIAVDTREFSCTTPIHINEKGFWIVPMVLTVGDYILSDQICIERKAVSTGDLFESFKSGRLLQQVTNMERFYDKPILLIEFDDSIPFRLGEQLPTKDIGNSMSSPAAGGEIDPKSIISKLALLTIHFKKL